MALDRSMPQHDAQVVLPLHDAFLVEAPAAAAREVAVALRTEMLAAAESLVPGVGFRASVSPPMQRWR